MAKPQYKILEVRTYYQHFCKICWHVFYGTEKGVILPCPKHKTTEYVVARFEKPKPKE